MSTYDYIVHQREKAEEEAREREIEEMEAQKSKTAKVSDELPVTLSFIVGVQGGDLCGPLCHLLSDKWGQDFSLYGMRKYAVLVAHGQ